MNPRIAFIAIALRACNLNEVSAQFIPGDMILVEGGSFTMGCTKEQSDVCLDDEKPAHRVSIRSFYINKFEVTQKQYQGIMGNNPSQHSNCVDCPVENVSWNDAQEFINKLNANTGKNYRLPTEAEWEYAARGGKLGTGTKYSGSDDMNKVGWFYPQAMETTHVVGLKLPNKLGLYDMSGNVGEYCSDWYSDVYYEQSTSDNPKGLERGENKVLRGGMWKLDADFCRVSSRLRTDPSGHSSYFGFRLAQDL